MPSSRTVYVDSELAGSWELTQPTPVDGSGYTEPLITTGGVYAYTDEDDAAAALQTGVLTIPLTAAEDDEAFIWTSVTDETDTAAVGTAPATQGQNENQQLDSDRTGGTFELTFDGQTTASALDASAETAANVETALETLSNVGVGDITCTGGPLPAPINMEFTGALALSDEVEITVTDSGTGGTEVAVTTLNHGAPVRNFSSEGDFNIPQDGDNFQPQLHLWSLRLDPGDPGVLVDVTHSDHATNRSIASGLIMATNLDATTPVEVIGSEDAGNAANFGGFGSITPLTEGAKVIALLGKAIDGGASTYYATSDSPSVPSGLIGIQEALADAMTVTAWKSGVLSANAMSPSDPTWSQLALWASGMFVLKPATAASAGASLEAVTAAEDTNTWIDISEAAGSLYEVLELDLTSLPAGAVITSANVELGHQCSVRNGLRAVLVGINADDTIELCVEQEPSGYFALPLGQLAEINSADWEQTASGSPLSSFTRLGVAIISTARHPFVEDHRIFWVRSTVQYDEGGPAVSNVVGPTTPGDPITWDYDSDAGLAQTHYQTLVINGSAQDPDSATVADNPLNPSAGEIVYDSGQVPSVTARSLSIEDAPLSNGTHTVAVRAWATTTSGQSVASAWDTDDFDLTGTPTAPGTQATEPVFNETTGGVDVDVTVPSGVTRAWLLRSEDSGATYRITSGSPFTVVAGADTLTDYFAPTLLETIRYQVTFDNGVMSETDTPVQAGSGADLSTPAAVWYFRVDDDPTLNTPVFVRSWDSTEGLRVQVAQQGAAGAEEARALVASSRTLAVTLPLSIWLRSAAERLAIAAVIQSGFPIRVSDIWGREYLVRPITGQKLTPRRAKSNLADGLAAGIKLKDLHVMDVTLVGSVIVA